jgi:hypothetical protein
MYLLTSPPMRKREAVVHADTLHDFDPTAASASLNEQIKSVPESSSTPLPHNSE